jgi:hypothetical protein
MLVVVEEVGDVVDAYDFYPYGLQMPERSYNDGYTEDTYKYASKEKDEELNLDNYYFGARYAACPGVCRRNI